MGRGMVVDKATRCGLDGLYFFPGGEGMIEPVQTGPGAQQTRYTTVT